MNAADNSKLNGIVTALGILVLVIGTASGNAYVMLAMAVAALAGIAIVSRRAMGWRALVAMTAAAATAFAVAIGITSL
jgi:hypothetical protein